MLMNIKKFTSLVMVAALPLMMAACGDGDHETNPPAVALTTSTVSSTTDSAHAHTASIPFGDIVPAPGIVSQYRSDPVSGHSHVIALSSQQMTDLSNGMRLSLASSEPNNGVAPHTHIFNIQGGSVLYEKNCYNCHSNDKRNGNPMNVSFNSSQTAAVKNPVVAPLSNSPAATADPNYVPPTTVNAASVYAGLCAGCHSLGTVDTVPGSGPNLSGKGGLVSGKFPTPGAAGHNNRTLTAAEISALVVYFNAN